MPIKDDRVQLVIADCGEVAGAGQRAVWELATRLPAGRFQTEVWLSSAVGMDAMADALRAAQVTVSRLPAATSSFSWRAFFGVWLKLRRTRPTLLHLHWAGGPVHHLSNLLAEAAGQARVVVTRRTVETGGPTVTRALERRVLARADAVTTVCGTNADLLVRELGVPRAQVHVVPDGVDAPDPERDDLEARQMRDRFGAGPLRPLWVCLERQEPGRGHDVLLRALAKVRERGLPFVAVLAGEGRERPSLERLIETLALRNQVSIVDPTQDLETMLDAADAVIVPSLIDRFTATIPEALARARPVVATVKGNAPEWIEHGETGWLTPAGDIDTLARVLEEIHRHSDRALRIAAEASERTCERHAWPRMVEAFEAVYDEALGLATFVPAEDGASHTVR